MPLPEGIRTVADRWRAAHLSTREEQIRSQVLQSFADGATPTVEALATTSRMAAIRIREILRRLAATDLLLLDSTEETVLAAYPFSSTPTPHRVRLPGRVVFALCAVDALGISAMLRETANITSRCAHCQAPVEVEVRPEQVTSARPADLVVWFPALPGRAPVAHVRCPMITFFCNRTHLTDWRRQRGESPGIVLSLLDAFEAGRQIFGRLLAGCESHVH